MKSVIYLEYLGALMKLLFRTSGVLVLAMIIIATIQSLLMAFYFADFAKLKMTDMLSVLNYTPQQITKMSLYVSGGASLIAEFFVILFTLNRKENWGIGIAVFFGVLSLSSYAKFIDFGFDFNTFQFSGSLASLISAGFLAIFPALTNAMLANLIVNKDKVMPFRKAIDEMIAAVGDYEYALSKVDKTGKDSWKDRNTHSKPLIKVA